MVTDEGGDPNSSPLPGDRQRPQQLEMGDKVDVSAKPRDDRSIPVRYIKEEFQPVRLALDR